MADLKALLGDQLPKLALGLMAAKAGGPAAVSAFRQGLTESMMRQQQLARQSEMDALSQDRFALEQQNMLDDNARQDEAARIQKLHQALGLITTAANQQAETATDPAAAQAALSQTAQSAAGLYGVDPTQLAGMVPNVAPAISARQRRQAMERYKALKDIYGEEAVASDSITDNGEQFKGMKPSQILALAGMSAQDPSGAQAIPAGAPKAKGLQILDLGGRKVVVDPAQLQAGQTFDDVPVPSRPTAPERDTEPLVAIMGPDGSPVLVPRSQAVGKRPANTREQGRPVQSGDANRIIDIDTGLNDLKTLRTALTQTSKATGTRAAIGAALPNAVTEFTGWGTDAKKRQGVIALVKQIIGKALEGGVLRKEDEYKYARILPTISDPADVALSKLDGLEQELQSKRGIFLEGLADANFDVSKYTTSGTTPAGAPEQDPLGLFK